MALASERLVQLYPFLKKIHAMLQELITEDQGNQFRKNTGMPWQENVKSSLLMILSVSPPPSLSILEPGDVPEGKYQSYYKRVGEIFKKLSNCLGQGQGKRWRNCRPGGNPETFLNEMKDL